jgi:WD40 repeat protein
MISLNWKRLALVLVAAMLALWSNVPVSSGQEKSASDQGPRTQKTDPHGDPLPEGASARMGTLRWRHPAIITFVGFLSNNQQLLTGCGDGYFRVWDTVRGKEIRKFGKPPDLNDAKIGVTKKRPGGRFVISNSNLALSADARLLAEVAADGNVRLWDVAGGKEIRTFSVLPKVDKGVKGGPFRGTGISSITFSPDGKVLASLEINQVIRLWDTGTGKEIHQIGKPPNLGKDQAVPLFIALRGGNSLAFLADGKTIVSAGMELDNQMQAAVLRIHDAASGKELKRIKSEVQNFFLASGLATLPQSKTIAWAGRDGTIRLYDADSGKEIRKVGSEKKSPFMRTLLFSPDGKILATQSGTAEIQLWDVASGKQLRKLGERVLAGVVRAFPGGGLGIAARGNSIAFSRDGKTLAEATAGNTVRLWKVDSGEEIVPVSSGHHGSVNRLAVSADGKMLTTFAGDQTIRQWDVATGKELRRNNVPAVMNVAFSGDGKLAAWNNAAKVTLSDVAQAKEIRTIDLPGQKPKGFGVAGLLAAPTFSADGKWLAVRGADQVLRVFDATSGKEFRSLVERNVPAPDPAGGFLPIRVLGRTAMGFSADGAVLAATSTNIRFGGPGGGGMGPGSGFLRLWNLSHGRNPRLFETDKMTILDLVVSPNGQNVVTANGDQTIAVWEALTGKECLQIKLENTGEKPPLQPLTPPTPFGGPGIITQGNAFALAISPDGRTLATGFGRQVHLFDLRTGKELGRFKGHQGTVVSLAFAPDSQTVVSGSADTTALVWDGGRFIKKPSLRDVPAEQLSDLWKDLAGDPVKAYQAIGALSAAPVQAVALVKEKVQPAARGDEKRVAQWIADLESNMFQVRKTATKELEKLGELVEPALQKSMQTLKALEAKRRVEKLLAQIADDQVPSAEVLRTLRAVQVLGQIATPEARTELERLAKGAPGDKLTRSAETALKRLAEK